MCHCVKKALVGLPLMLQLLSSYSQKPLPSVDRSDSLFQFYFPNQIDLAESFARLGYARAMELSDSHGIARHLSNIGRVNYLRGDYRNSLLNYREGLSIRILQKDSAMMAAGYLNIGNVYKQMGEFEKALENYYLAEGLIYQHQESRDLAFCYLNIGIVYQRQNDYKGAEKILKKSQKLFVLQADTDNIINCYINLGNIEAEQGHLDEGLNYYRSALKLGLSKGNLKSKANIYNNIGNVQYEKGVYDSALTCYNKGLALFKALGIEIDIANSFLNMARTHEQLRNYDEALSLYKQGEAIADKLKAKELLAEIYLGLSDLFYFQQNFKPSVDYYYSYDSLSNLIMNEEKQRQISEMEVKYETREKEREIGLLKENETLSQETIRQQATQRNGLIVGSVLLLLLSAATGIAYRQKRRANQLLQTQKAIVEERNRERELLMKELHHRVKNNLQIVSSILNLQSAHLDDNTAAQAVKESQCRVEAMALIHRELYRDEQVTHLQIRQYIENLAANVVRSFGYDESVLDIHIEPEQMEVQTAIPLGLVVNELITNACKHAFPDRARAQISISLEPAPGGQLVLTVGDNGVGLNDPVSASGSFGMELVRSLVRQLHGQLDISGGQGTTFKVGFNEYKHVLN